ncbi:hypothetical protein SDC9_113879 [bioreactor metagenome]|uniref:Uncharacterized protein n=1 Tax=bioreactor metagenome TaxID=1076179 RepID=A0A645BNY2_9ZZZZ
MDRADPAFDTGHRPDQPAAASRHLLDRGSQAVDPRPQVRQSVGSGARQAGLRDRCGHGRRRRQQGEGRCGADLRPRRWYRCGSVDLDQACGRPVGARLGRDPADPAAQWPARPHCGAVRWSVEDRTRCHHRGAVGSRGVRCRDDRPGHLGMHPDARLPQGHLPGGRGDPEPGTAREVRRQARVCRQLYGVHCPGSA